jgi:hypothetical protein
VATLGCITCTVAEGAVQYFCEIHGRAHAKEKKNAGHDVQDLAGVQTAISNTRLVAPAKCPKHPQAVLSIYCNDCKTGACPECAWAFHRTHNSVSAEDFRTEVAKKTQHALQSVSDVEANISSSLVAVDDARRALNEDRRRALEEMEQYRQKIASLVDARFRTLQAELSSRYDDLELELQERGRSLSTTSQSLKSAVVLGQAIVSGRPDLAFMAPSVVDYVHGVRESEVLSAPLLVDKPRCQVNMAAVTDTIAAIGTVGVLQPKAAVDPSPPQPSQAGAMLLGVALTPPPIRKSPNHDTAPLLPKCPGCVQYHTSFR